MTGKCPLGHPPCEVSVEFSRPVIQEKQNVGISSTAAQAFACDALLRLRCPECSKQFKEAGSWVCDLTQVGSGYRIVRWVAEAEKPVTSR